MFTTFWGLSVNENEQKNGRIAGIVNWRVGLPWIYVQAVCYCPIESAEHSRLDVKTQPIKENV